MKVAVSLDDQLEPGTLEHTIHDVVENRLDLSGFDQERSHDETGRPGYDPRVLLKVVLLGYARGLLSSRRLEAACRQNILFMALTCGQRPDHSTSAEFVSGMGEERISALFSQVLLVCTEEGLLGGTHFAIDGYKLSSNAAKECSGTHADLRKKQEQLRELVRQSVRAHRRNDRERTATSGSPGQRVAHLERQAARIERLLQENEPRVGRMGREVQSHVTDNESAKMKSRHGIIQGDNANAKPSLRPTSTPTCPTRSSASAIRASLLHAATAGPPTGTSSRTEANGAGSARRILNTMRRVRG